ncbi:MAG: hypothetical protein ABIR91_02660 [Candidatus Saccharimonadales bacterium]
MGLFDDFIGLARDINGLKEDVAKTVKQVAVEATGLRDEATHAVTQLRSEASSTVNHVKTEVAATKAQVIDGVTRKIKGDQ